MTIKLPNVSAMLHKQKPNLSRKNIALMLYAKDNWCMIYAHTHTTFILNQGYYNNLGGNGAIWQSRNV